MNAPGDSDHRISRIREGLRNAQRRRQLYRYVNVATALVSITGSAAVTAFAGGSSLAGDPLFADWPTVVMWAAIVSLLAAIAAGVREAFRIPDKASRAAASVRKLAALEFGLASGVITPEEADKRYLDALAEDAEFIS